MRNTRTLWIIAIVVTIGSAVYQRMTGPTYPARGHVVLGGDAIDFRLERSHETTGDQWFSEAQTESYRTLGEYSIREMCYGFSGDSLADLATQLAGTDATIVAP